jgi:(S)-ureidoglycine aminohydrolase
MNQPQSQTRVDHTLSRGKLAWFILLLLFSTSILMAQSPVKSDVYPWNNSPVVKTEYGSTRTIVKGMGTDFEFMDVSAATLEQGKARETTSHAEFEEMVIVKDGSLKITINGQSKTVGRGSVAIVMPGDEHSYANAGDGEVSYYVFRYKSKNPVDMERAKKSGGSFVMDWNDVKFNSRSDGKGGTRSFFTKSTAMGKRLELHSTLLEPNQSSHTPHHHRAEEMVVILHADTEMYLGPEQEGGRSRKATDGDIIYLVSNEYHAISNIGDESALYFAFQFE